MMITSDRIGSNRLNMSFKTNHSHTAALRPTSLVVNLRVDFGDVPSGELHDSGLALPRLIRGNQHGYARTLCLCERVRQICDLISGDLSPVRVRKLTVCHQDSQLTVFPCEKVKKLFVNESARS